MAGEEQQLRRRVVELICVHRPDHAHLIGDGVEVRAGVAHRDPAFAILRKSTRRAHELRHPGGEGKAPAFENRVGAVLPAAFHQLRFVIKQVKMRRRSRHVQVDHALRLRRKLRPLRCQRIVRHRRRTGSRLLLQRMHGNGSQAELPRVAEKLPARRELKSVVGDGVHGEADFDVAGCDFKFGGVFRDESQFAYVVLRAAGREAALVFCKCPSARRHE